MLSRTQMFQQENRHSAEKVLHGWKSGSTLCLYRRVEYTKPMTRAVGARLHAWSLIIICNYLLPYTELFAVRDINKCKYY